VEGRPEAGDRRGGLCVRICVLISNEPTSARLDHHHTGFSNGLKARGKIGSFTEDCLLLGARANQVVDHDALGLLLSCSAKYGRRAAVKLARC
jgi:hypothetical protein